MKKRLLLVIALVAALSLVAAAPVSADGDKPINGKMELNLELAPCTDGRFVTWVGTVVIDGTTYGWADFPTADDRFDKKFMYFEEYWRIFTLEPGEDPTVALACDNGLVVLDGINDGRGTAGGSAQADGTVESGYGPFADVDPGSRMIWRGKITNFKEDTLDLKFKATLHIFPLK